MHLTLSSRTYIDFWQWVILKVMVNLASLTMNISNLLLCKEGTKKLSLFAYLLWWPETYLRHFNFSKDYTSLMLNAPFHNQSLQLRLWKIMKNVLIWPKNQDFFEEGCSKADLLSKALLSDIVLCHKYRYLLNPFVLTTVRLHGWYNFNACPPKSVYLC
jgi:hypothetical protein